MQDDNGKSEAQLVTLRRWTVVAVVTGNGARSRHVWGHDVDADTGCVSDAIADFSMDTMTVTTESGVRYRLGGVPAHSRRGQATWDEWCKAHDVIAQLEVTTEYMDPNDMSTRQFVALNVSAFSGKTN